MSSYNRVILMGNLTRTPEHKQLPSGQAVCKMTIATNRQFKSKNSQEAVQEVCFIDVDVWGPQAESCKKYLDKGSSVLVEGRLKQDSWQDADGQKRSRHVVVADRVTFVSASKPGAEDDSMDEGFGEELPKQAPKRTPVSSSSAQRSTGQSKTMSTGRRAGFGELRADELEADLPF